MTKSRKKRSFISSAGVLHKQSNKLAKLSELAELENLTELARLADMAELEKFAGLARLAKLAKLGTPHVSEETDSHPDKTQSLFPITVHCDDGMM